MGTTAGTITPGSIVNADLHPKAGISPSKMGLLARDFVLPLSSLIKWDTLQPLPNAAAGDALGLSYATFGTGFATINSGDVKSLGTTNRYALLLFNLPSNYEDGQAVSLKLLSGMSSDSSGTLADTSAVLDAEVYVADETGHISGTDLCATAAQDVNNTTLAVKTFVIDPTSLTAGSQLMIRLKLSVVDAAGADPVIAQIARVAIACACRG